jgi:transcriptional regulator with XRE-family HTH domain
MDIYDARRARVATLMQERKLNQSAFGELVDVNPNTVSRWFQTGAGRKNIGEKVARRIEEKLELPRAWLDGIEPVLVTVSEPVAAYNAQPMPLSTVLSLLATHLDAAAPASRPLIADMLQRFVLDPAARESATLALLAVVPQPSPDERVASAYGDPKAVKPRGR